MGDSSITDFECNCMSRSIIKQLLSMSQRRHPRTGGGHLAIDVVLPTGALDREEGVSAELESADCNSTNFSGLSF